MDFAQKNRDIISKRTIDSLPNIIANKTAGKMKSLCIWKLCIFCLAVSVDLNYFNIFKFTIAFTQGVYQQIGRHCSPLKKHAIIRFYNGYGLFRRNYLHNYIFMQRLGIGSVFKMILVRFWKY